MTVGQVTTPVFRLRGLIPGSVLYLRQRSPAGGGAPESSPSVVLWGGAAFTALGDVNCFHELMSFLVAAWQAPGLPATERASHMSPPTICLIVPNRQLRCNSVSDSSFVGFALDWPSSRRRCRWLGSAFEVWRSTFSAHASLFPPRPILLRCPHGHQICKAEQDALRLPLRLPQRRFGCAAARTARGDRGAGRRSGQMPDQRRAGHIP